MEANILTSKGTVTIPASVRRQLGLKPGNKVIFLPKSSTEVVIKPLIEVKNLREENRKYLKNVKGQINTRQALEKALTQRSK